MFFVELLYKDGNPRLGNCEGQGFYRYKRIVYVKRILENHKIVSKYFLQDCKQYNIYSCNDQNKFSDNLPLVCSVAI